MLDHQLGDPEKLQFGLCRPLGRDAKSLVALQDDQDMSTARGFEFRI